MNRILMLCLMFLAFVSNAREMTLRGTYQGKDLYVRNTFDPGSNAFCISAIYVNDKLVMEKPEITAIRINLGVVAKGERVTVRIVHSDNCTPKVLNPEVLKLDRDFRFIDIVITNNSVDFTTEGEKSLGKFVVEMMFTNNDLTTYWEDQFEVTAKGEIDINRYSAEPRHYSGDNVYRIRYEPLEGEKVYSEEVTYTNTKKPITFEPRSVTTKITLSDYAEFEITDMNGRLIKKGNAKEIMLQELKPGEYYIKLQNRFEKFVKK